MQRRGTWRYRVIRDDEGGHRVAEVYDLSDGSRPWSTNPAYPWGDTLEELQSDMNRMMLAFDLPVLVEAELRAAQEGGESS